MKKGEHLEKGNHFILEKWQSCLFEKGKHFILEKWQSCSFEKGKHIGLPVRIRPQCNSDNVKNSNADNAFY